MMKFAGRTALITGASSGIGEEFARRLAQRGACVVLVARRRERLDDLAAELRDRCGVDAHVVVADLSRPGAGAEVVSRVTDLGVTVDVLVNNAGFGSHGHVHRSGPERLVDQVQVNVAAVVDLTSRLLPGMVDRHFGAVINVASNAAFQPIPAMAVYAASKAFVLSFSHAVAEEVRPHGIRVLAVSPGATTTEFVTAAGSDSVSGGVKPRTAEQVVTTALRGLDRGVPAVVDGTGTLLRSYASRFLGPRRAAVLAGRMVNRGQ